MELKPGDVVQLKSRGPDMTVEKIASSKDVSCVWFNGKDVQRSIFRQEVLAKNPPPLREGVR